MPTKGNKLMKLAPTPMPVAAKATREDAERQRRYQAEDDLRTITRAQEVQGDKRRMSSVQALAREQAASLSRIAGRKKR